MIKLRENLTFLSCMRCAFSMVSAGTADTNQTKTTKNNEARGEKTYTMEAAPAKSPMDEMEERVVN